MSPPQPIRVIVGEDQAFVREGIVHVLAEGGFDVVGTTADALDLIRIASAYGPDVVVADIQMPPGHADDGLQAALAIRAAQPGVGVLVLSQFLEDSYAFDLMADGAQGVGYMLKEKVGNLDMFTDAVRRVADGGSALDPAIVSRLVGRSRRDNPIDTLTAREREVLTLMAEGMSNFEIAERLGIGEKTVKTHVSNVLGKLNVSDRTQAAVYAWKSGLKQRPGP